MGLVDADAVDNPDGCACVELVIAAGVVILDNCIEVGVVTAPEVDTVDV
jgi:hypothetical protein